MHASSEAEDRCGRGSHRAEPHLLDGLGEHGGQLHLVVPHQLHDVTLAEDASGVRVLERLAREQPVVHLHAAHTLR